MPPSSSSSRLDKALTRLYPDLSRNRLQALIRSGHVTVNGRPQKDPAHKLKGGEKLDVQVPEAATARPRPKKIPLDIVFEDAHLLVINKPAGLVVHPAAGHADDTLVNALLAHCGASLSGIGGEARPGIVHRLDKDTSGLMVVAKNDKAHQGLSAQFADHKLARVYVAFVWGLPKSKTGTIEGAIGRSSSNRKKMAMIGARTVVAGALATGTERTAQKQKIEKGKSAITHYEVMQAYGTLAAKVSCTLETGRTHQIRVHLSSLGTSVMGDPLYGRAKGHQSHPALKKLNESARKTLLAFPRQALHAAELSFTHPVSKKALRFQAALPDDMKKLAGVLDKLAAG